MKKTPVKPQTTATTPSNSSLNVGGLDMELTQVLFEPVWTMGKQRCFLF